MDYPNVRPEMEESNIVFLGNVAYGTTEEQLRKMLELAGPVVDIRLVFDSQTNRAKGYGFCQFADTSIAASAIKNLNDTLVDGRNIKIGYADRKRVKRYLGTDGTNLGDPRGDAATRSIDMDTVDQLVGSLDPASRWELVAQFRAFAEVNPGKAKTELMKNPGMAWSILKSMEAEGLVGQTETARIRGASNVDYTMATGTVRPPGPPPHSPFQRPPPPPPPSSLVMQQQQQQQQQQQTTAFQGAGAPPVPSASMPIPAASTGPSAAELDNAEVLKQLLSLTDEQLAQLPEDHRQQIIDLKRQLQA
ncbi:Cleavage stimulation factor subunit 2 [Coemansia sp. Benny D115]|nr:Cleavage stimulation factor subunit 2 [Coemansia sp. Benny D115]